MPIRSREGQGPRAFVLVHGVSATHVALLVRHVQPHGAVALDLPDSVTAPDLLSLALAARRSRATPHILETDSHPLHRSHTRERVDVISGG